MKKEESGILSCVGVFVIALVSVVGGSVMNGWVLSILWSWFVIPIFGLPSISIPLAIGFSLVIGMLSKSKDFNTSGNKKSTGEAIVELLGMAFGTPMITLLIGYIVKLFI